MFVCDKTAVIYSFSFMLVRLLALVAGFGQHAPHLLHNAPVNQRAPPPVGANYKKTLSLPVIGDQTVVLNILSAARAKLVISRAAVRTRCAANVDA